jgi:hypothetical protein
MSAMAPTLGPPAPPRPACRSRDLALALISSRVIRPTSKLSTLGRQLQQRGDPGRARQLGVRDPGLLAVPDQEVGEADEATVEHRGLVHHRMTCWR